MLMMPTFHKLFCQENFITVAGKHFWLQVPEISPELFQAFKKPSEKRKVLGNLPANLENVDWIPMEGGDVMSGSLLIVLRPCDGHVYVLLAGERS